jgi:hypothetical protein
LLTKESIKNRIIRRFALTFKRNESVYNDFLKILNDYCQTQYQPLPLKAISKYHLQIYLGSISNHLDNHSLQFEREDGIFYYYKSKLIGGPDVSLQFLSPFDSQRRKYNLYPYTLISNLISFIPQLNFAHSLLSYTLFQFDNSLEKEKTLV